MQDKIFVMMVKFSEKETVLLVKLPAAMAVTLTEHAADNLWMRAASLVQVAFIASPTTMENCTVLQ